MRGERVGEAGERHVAPGIERVEKRLKLRQVRMIADVAAVEELHRQIAPRIPVQSRQLLRMELVVQQAAFAAHQMRMKVVGLQTIDDGRALADAAVRELENG